MYRVISFIYAQDLVFYGCVDTMIPKFLFCEEKIVSMVCLYGKSDCYGVSTTFIGMSSVGFRYIIMMEVNK